MDKYNVLNTSLWTRKDKMFGLVKLDKLISLISRVLHWRSIDFAGKQKWQDRDQFGVTWAATVATPVDLPTRESSESASPLTRLSWEHAREADRSQFHHSTGFGHWIRRFCSMVISLSASFPEKNMNLTRGAHLSQSSSDYLFNPWI